jgi:hypothetical protein
MSNPHKLAVGQKLWFVEIDLDACYEGPGGTLLITSEATGEEVEIPATGHPRYVFTEVNGPIRPGMVISHICGRRTCLNPRHMRLVDPKERARR